MERLFGLRRILMAECPICDKNIGLFDLSAVGGRYQGSYAEFCSDDCAAIGWKEESNRVVEESNRVVADTPSENLAEKASAVARIPFFTSETIASLSIETALGTARGATVRSKHVGTDIAAGLKSIVGGELTGYTKLLAEGREEAIYRMKADAHEMGANAIVMTRFTTSMIADGAVEVMAYGTAVIVEGQETK
jgi:uncharacterized protein YbjQ (UPF0145 family)/endogenous inhibitor of DNA gyrase (YacG/DUF329 family)